MDTADTKVVAAAAPVDTSALEVEAAEVVSPDVVVKGHSVVYRKGDQLKIGVAEAGSKGRFGQLFFNLEDVIGHPYGSVFEVQKNGKLVLSTLRPDVMVTDVDSAPTGDNREIYDRSESQRLDQDDIAQLKEEGVTGEDIIRKLVENSNTFQKRTEFSQAKYLRKKQQKYLQLVTILKPCARVLCELFAEKFPPKISFLRVDSLAQLLMQAHVHPGMRLLVADTCLGLVTGAALERMGGYGECVQFYMGDSTSMSALEAFNLTPAQRGIMQQYPMDELDEIAKLAALSEEELNAELREVLEKKANSDADAQRKWDDIWERRVTRRAETRIVRKKVAETIQKAPFDGLVIATRFHPMKLLMDLLPYLGYSRPFAVFFPYREPLIEAYQACRTLGGLLRLDLFETWTRPYQVLPLRTHPMMSMKANSGFILTGIKVDNSGAAPPGLVPAQSTQKTKKPRTRR